MSSIELNSNTGSLVQEASQMARVLPHTEKAADALIALYFEAKARGVSMRRVLTNFEAEHYERRLLKNLR